MMFAGLKVEKRRVSSQDQNSQILDRISRLPGQKIRVGLAICGDVESLKMQKFCQKLNSLGDIFEYSLQPNISINPNGEEYDAPHCHSHARYFKRLKAARTLLDECPDLLIGITHDSLEGSVFNKHNESENLGIVTTYNFEDYLPLGMVKEQFVAYLVLCESFCIASEKDLEHEESRFDLFDLCREKSDLAKCLEKPYIGKESRKSLLAEGFPDQAGLKILKYVKSRSVWKTAKEILEKPIYAYPVGTGLGLAAPHVVEGLALNPGLVGGGAVFGLVMVAIATGLVRKNAA